MDLSQIRSRIRKVTGFTMPELYSDSDLDTLVNEVYADILGTADWPFLYVDDTVAIADGDSTVTLPAPVRTFTSVRIDDSRLRETTVDEIDMLDPDEDGEPEVYARIDEEQLLLWPASDAAYTLKFRGFLQADALAVDTDEPVFEQEFRPVLVYETASRILIEFGDFERVEGFRGQAADILSRMKVRYQGSKDRAPVQMGGRVRDRRRWTVG